MEAGRGAARAGCGRAAAAAVLAWVAAAQTAAAEPATYVLEPGRSFVHFEILHFGTSTIRGRFGAVQGSVVVDRAAGGGEAHVRIATASVSTGLPHFDDRIREPDLLAAREHPEAWFVSTRMRLDAAGLPAELSGEFTLRGTSQPLVLRAQRAGCRSEGQAEFCGGDFEGELRRSDFGASYGLPLVGDRVRLLVRVEGRRVP